VRAKNRAAGVSGKHRWHSAGDETWGVPADRIHMAAEGPQMGRDVARRATSAPAAGPRSRAGQRPWGWCRDRPQSTLSGTSASGLDADPGFRIEQARPAEAASRPTFVDRARARLSGRPGTQFGESPIGNLAAADLLAANDLLGHWPAWMAKRRAVQARRRRADADIFRLFLRPLWCVEEEAGYRALFDGVTDFFGIRVLFDGLTVMPEDPKG
jgi:hypothetical protein